MKNKIRLAAVGLTIALGFGSPAVCPSIIADKNGAAKLSFALPDNLTGWRVFAIATTPSDQLGLGEYKFKSSKLTEVRPVLPNQLTAGDRFTAGFSVLNRSDKTRTLEVELLVAAAHPLCQGPRP